MREEKLREAENDPLFEIGIVGGELHGLILAAELSLLGYRTILFEKGDFAALSYTPNLLLTEGIFSKELDTLLSEMISDIELCEPFMGVKDQARGLLKKSRSLVMHRLFKRGEPLELLHRSTDRFSGFDMAKNRGGLCRKGKLIRSDLLIAALLDLLFSLGSFAFNHMEVESISDSAIACDTLFSRRYGFSVEKWINLSSQSRFAHLPYRLSGLFSKSPVIISSFKNGEKDKAIFLKEATLLASSETLTSMAKKSKDFQTLGEIAKRHGAKNSIFSEQRVLVLPIPFFLRERTPKLYDLLLSDLTHLKAAKKELFALMRLQKKEVIFPSSWKPPAHLDRERMEVAIHFGMARSLEDLFYRRSPLFYQQRECALEMVPKAAALLARSLGKSLLWQEKAIASFRLMTENRLLS